MGAVIVENEVERRMPGLFLLFGRFEGMYEHQGSDGRNSNIPSTGRTAATMVTATVRKATNTMWFCGAVLLDILVIAHSEYESNSRRKIHTTQAPQFLPVRDIGWWMQRNETKQQQNRCSR